MVTYHHQGCAAAGHFRHGHTTDSSHHTAAVQARHTARIPGSGQDCAQSDGTRKQQNHKTTPSLKYHSLYEVCAFLSWAEQPCPNIASR